jgi:transcriptional regulator with XRE-family HTH domain
MDFSGMNDNSILNELGSRIQQRRLSANITQTALAQKAGVSRMMIQKLETGHGCTLRGLVRITRALGIIGQWDIFLPEMGFSPLQLAKFKGRERQRASKPGEDV